MSNCYTSSQQFNVRGSTELKCITPIKSCLDHLTLNHFPTGSSHTATITRTSYFKNLANCNEYGNAWLLVELTDRNHNKYACVCDIKVIYATSWNMEIFFQQSCTFIQRGLPGSLWGVLGGIPWVNPWIKMGCSKVEVSAEILGGIGGRNFTGISGEIPSGISEGIQKEIL